MARPDDATRHLLDQQMVGFPNGLVASVINIRSLDSLTRYWSPIWVCCCPLSLCPLSRSRRQHNKSRSKRHFGGPSDSLIKFIRLRLHEAYSPVSKCAKENSSRANTNLHPDLIFSSPGNNLSFSLQQLGGSRVEVGEDKSPSENPR